MLGGATVWLLATFGMVYAAVDLAVLDVQIDRLILCMAKKV